MIDVGERPTPKHTLDRIDNNGNYAPGNVRWATRTEQARNTRANRLITIGNETKTLAAWIVQSGFNASMVERRLARGWDEAEAVTAQPNRNLRLHRSRR